MRIVTLTTLTFDKKKIFLLFFHQMKAKWNIFHTSFLIFHKGNAPYDVEYGLNFDKNAKNVDLSKKSRDKS